LIQIDGVVLADVFANTAFLLFEVKTVLIDVGDERNGLGVIDVNRFVGR
jgi:hypothetical protein